MGQTTGRPRLRKRAQPDMSTEGDLTRQAREARAWSVQELASRAGVGTTTINDIEHGKRQVGRKKLAVVAQALGLRPGHLDDAGRPDAADVLRNMEDLGQTAQPMSHERMAEVTDSGRQALEDVLDRLTPAEIKTLEAMGRELLRLRAEHRARPA